MEDDLDLGFDFTDTSDGTAAASTNRVLVGVAAEGGDDADPLALARALLDAEGELVTAQIPEVDGAATIKERARHERSDLIVIGSEPGGRPGKVSLGAVGEAVLDGATRPVAVAPIGLAGEDGYTVRRIDVGLDGSQESTAALKAAARLAIRLDARLRLVAVAELRFDLGGSPRPSDPVELRRLERHLAHATEGLPGLWIETDLREGLVDQTLIGMSRDTDLLVLGSRATYGDGGRTSLGSVATGVLRSASCPTLIVPAP